MNKELLTEARRLAQVIGQRLHLRLPSILAEGEEFELKMGVTGPDAMPVEGFAYDLHFEKSIGIAGLPPTFRFDPSQSAASIKGLKATRAGVALASARVDAPQAPKPAVVYSNPAWISKDPAVRLFWGDLHIHTRYSNCSAWRCLDPEWGYQYARDVSFLDFAAAADHLRGIASDPARWPRLQELARLYNEPRRFVSFLAFESSHAQGYGGDNNVYFLGDDAPHFWVEREDMRGGSPQVHLRDLWQQMDRNKKPYFTVPHHTGRARKFRSWDEDRSMPGASRFSRYIPAGDRPRCATAAFPSAAATTMRHRISSTPSGPARGLA
ncbi:MAG: hypothetical protein WC299_11205 [Kiritimatiellia bacterium]